MKSGSRNLVLCVMIVFSMACGLAGQAVPKGQVTPQSQIDPQEVTTTFSAQAVSPASVSLRWPAEAGAGGYSLRVRYGDGDFLPAADLPSDQLTFTHFVVPGTSQVAYQLAAQTAAGEREIGTLNVNLPDLVPNPRVVGTQVFAPTSGEMSTSPVLPTLDPSNPDPFALATAMAELAGSIEGSTPQTGPVHIRQEVGPEGGTVLLTDPNQVVYTLEFPAEAVDESTTITLIPVGALSDSPFAGGLLAAVQIQPPIPFAGPLKLTIALPADLAAPSATFMVGFAVSSFNNELSLAPIYDEGQNTYSMSVYWGDTLGLAAATMHDVEAQAARIPSDSGEQMAQQLAALRASSTEPTPEGDIRIAAQVLQGLLHQIQAVTSRTSPKGGPGLAAPAPDAQTAPLLQLQYGARLFASIQESERAWEDRNQTIPVAGEGERTDPGNMIARSMAAEQARIVAETTERVKTYLDEHKGCRTGVGLYADALRGILQHPETSFQKALAGNYLTRFGPPPSLECEFRLHIVRSSIEIYSQNGPENYLGNDTETFAVHSEPFPLELVVRGGTLSLRGSGGTVYDEWEITHSKCPPTMQLRPFPSELIWITDLRFVFDTHDRVSDFILVGVAWEVFGGVFSESEITTDRVNDQCRVLSEFPGSDPVDVWGGAFASLHNVAHRMDNWVIAGEESYVATDTIAGRVEGIYTEDTILVLTVNKK